MAAVPQTTLTWLWNVLTKVRTANITQVWFFCSDAFPQNHYDPNQTYRDPNRTYHDVVRALAQYPSLGPRTDVHSESVP